MSNVETLSDVAPQATTKWMKTARLFGLFRKPAKFIIGVFLSLTPITAVIVLGWLARLTERKSAKYFARRYSGDLPRGDLGWPGWFVCDGIQLASDEEIRASGRAKKSLGGFLALWLGGLWENLKAGVQSLIALSVLTLPFGALWFLGWWSGWQNSFTKGYEQAFAGPLISLLGIALSLASLSYLPMALTHLSLERRISAFFAIRQVMSLIHTAGWRYILLSLGFVVAAMPVFLANVTPVFIENIKPDILNMSPEAIAKFIGAHHFWVSVYILLTLVILRSWAARIYARSAAEISARGVSGWQDARLPRIACENGPQFTTRPPPPRPGKIRAVFLIVLLPTIWFGFVAQTYVGQFMNYKWWNWLNHPLIQIPWFPPLGPWG